MFQYARIQDPIPKRTHKSLNPTFQNTMNPTFQNTIQRTYSIRLQVSCIFQRTRDAQAFYEAIQSYRDRGYKPQRTTELTYQEVNGSQHRAIKQSLYASMSRANLRNQGIQTAHSHARIITFCNVRNLANMQTRLLDIGSHVKFEFTIVLTKIFNAYRQTHGPRGPGAHGIINHPNASKQLEANRQKPYRRELLDEQSAGPLPSLKPAARASR